MASSKKNRRGTRDRRDSPEREFHDAAWAVQTGIRLIKNYTLPTRILRSAESLHRSIVALTVALGRLERDAYRELLIAELAHRGIRK